MFIWDLTKDTSILLTDLHPIRDDNRLKSFAYPIYAIFPQAACKAPIWQPALEVKSLQAKASPCLRHC